MERKGVYTQVLGYNFPKERQSMIGLQVLSRLDRGQGIYEVYPYNGVWIIDQETFSIAPPMFLVMFGVTQSYFWIALTWSSGKGRTLGTQRIHRELLEHLMQFYQGR